MVKTESNSLSATQRFVVKIEKIGRVLPHPFVMYLMFCGIAIVASAAFGGYQFMVPGKTEPLEIFSFISAKGVRYILTDMFQNFSGLSVVTLMLFMALAVGIGEKAGLYKSLINKFADHLPDYVLISGYIFLCINGNLLSDATIVLLPPIGAMLFKSRGRNPLLALILTIVGYDGGLSARVILTGSDANILALTQDALSFLPITENLYFNLSCNYYFLFVSAIVLTITETMVAVRITEPVLNADKEIDWDGDAEYTNDIKLEAGQENRGLLWTGVATLVLVALWFACIIPANGLLRNDTGELFPKSPFLSTVPQVIFLLFAIAGVAYGYGAKTFKSGKDVAAGAMQGIRGITGILTIFVIASQFLAILKKSNLTSLVAVKGAEFLQNSGISGVFLVIGLLILVMFINMFIGSASVKWTMLAPVFVPMFAILGFSPAFTQVIYRVGDSLTNPINPVNSAMPLYVGYAQRYKKSASIGTIIAHCMPYSIVNTIVWGLLLAVWYLLNLPIGPGAGIALPIA